MKLPQLSVAHAVECTEAEGPGRRYALWLQGCPLRCPGCCNPEMLPFRGGKKVAVHVVTDQIIQAAKRHQIEGITLLGGEPFSQAAAVSHLASSVQASGLTVMAFTGFELEQLRAKRDASVDHLLQHVDLLIDGPYRRELPDSTRRWIGSTNQRIHCLTDRYHSQDGYWDEANTIEIRMRNGEVHVNGFPVSQAVSIWKRS